MARSEDYRTNGDSEHGPVTLNQTTKEMIFMNETERYYELTNKRFEDGLSPEEKIELDAIGKRMDTAFKEYAVKENLGDFRVLETGLPPE